MMEEVSTFSIAAHYNLFRMGLEILRFLSWCGHFLRMVVMLLAHFSELVMISRNLKDSTLNPAEVQIVGRYVHTML